MKHELHWTAEQGVQRVLVVPARGLMKIHPAPSSAGLVHCSQFLSIRIAFLVLAIGYSIGDSGMLTRLRVPGARQEPERFHWLTERSGIRSRR